MNKFIVGAVCLGVSLGANADNWKDVVSLCRLTTKEYLSVLEVSVDVGSQCVNEIKSGFVGHKCEQYSYLNTLQEPASRRRMEACSYMNSDVPEEVFIELNAMEELIDKRLVLVLDNEMYINKWLEADLNARLAALKSMKSKK